MTGAPPAPEDGSGEEPGGEVLARALAEGWSLERLEREYLLAVLRRTGGNRTRAAEILGVARRTVYRKLKQYEEAGLLDGRG